MSVERKYATADYATAKSRDRTHAWTWSREEAIGGFIRSRLAARARPRRAITRRRSAMRARASSQSPGERRLQRRRLSPFRDENASRPFETNSCELAPRPLTRTAAPSTPRRSRGVLRLSRSPSGSTPPPERAALQISSIRSLDRPVQTRAGILDDRAACSVKGASELICAPASDERFALRLVP